MKLLFSQTKLLIFFAVIVLFAGCKQPETIVVDESPSTAASGDTTTEDQAPGNEASFRQLIVGEHNAIKSMNPLFVENLSEMRAVQLIYEGLVRFDGSGSIVSGLAKDWSVSNDSLQYTFTLRPTIFYHDSEIFSTGTGRSLSSQDIKFVFERMAQSGVPPSAAQMFMDIEGFEPYYQEQHFVYNPKNRELNGVSGIQAPNDSTVVFQLVDQDPDFLRKLATPLALIYPREAVGENVESFTPVGTGPFVFSGAILIPRIFSPNSKIIMPLLILI
jgi:peptide/nickel transport system substrate-binding protein